MLWAIERRGSGVVAGRKRKADEIATVAKSAGVLSAEYRRDHYVPSVRTLRLDRIANPEDRVRLILRDTLNALRFGLGIDETQWNGFASVRVLGGVALVFENDSQESRIPAICAMQRLARLCFFYPDRVSDQVRAIWHDEITRLVHDAFHAPAERMGLDRQAIQIKAGFGRARQRTEERSQYWRAWQLLANKYWRSNPRLTISDVARSIERDSALHGYPGRFEVIRRRIKKVGK